MAASRNPLKLFVFKKRDLAFTQKILKNKGVWCSRYFLCNVTDTACLADQPSNSDKTVCQVPSQMGTIIYNIYN